MLTLKKYTVVKLSSMYTKKSNKLFKNILTKVSLTGDIAILKVKKGMLQNDWKSKMCLARKTAKVSRSEEAPNKIGQ